jgi:hypothetical protein
MPLRQFRRLAAGRRLPRRLEAAQRPVPAHRGARHGDVLLTGGAASHVRAKLRIGPSGEIRGSPVP